MKKIIFYSLILTILASGANFAKAAILDVPQKVHEVVVPTDKSKYVLLEPLPCIEGTGNNCTTGQTIKQVNINEYVGYVFKFAIALAVFLAVVVIIFSGFTYMLSETSIASKSAARTRITNAVLGLLGALASYLILATIDPRLVNIGVGIPPIQVEIQQDTFTFNSQLDKDLKQASTDSINKVYLLEQEIKALNDRQAELDKKLAKNEGNENDYIEYEKNKEAIKQKTGEQAEIIVTDKVRKDFAEALKGLHSSNATTAEGVLLGNRAGELNQSAKDNLQSQISKINEYYNQQISRTDLDPALAQKLRTQREFFVAQANEEQKVVEDILKNNTGTSVLGKTSAQLSDMIQKEKDSYTKQLEFIKADDTSNLNITSDGKTYEMLTKIKSDPLLRSEAATLLQDRINYLESSQEFKKNKTP